MNFLRVSIQRMTMSPVVTSSVRLVIHRRGSPLEARMSPLRLAYSNSNRKTSVCDLPSHKLKMSRATLSRLPRLLQQMIELQRRDPAAARVIERLVDDALQRTVM